MKSQKEDGVMMTDTNRLRELAEDVKNRDWEFVDQDSGQFVVAVVNRSKKGSAHDKIKHICGLAGFASKTEEFRFIAAANPQAIIALIDELEKTKAQLAEANWVLRFYGCVDSYFDGSVGLENSAIEDDMGAQVNQYLEKWKVGK